MLRSVRSEIFCHAVFGRDFVSRLTERRVLAFQVARSLKLTKSPLRVLGLVIPAAEGANHCRVCEFAPGHDSKSMTFASAAVCWLKREQLRALAWANRPRASS